MGYYTQYTLYIHANPEVQLLDEKANEKAAEVINKFFNDEENFGYAGCFDDESDGEHFMWRSSETIKWYDCDEDMKKLSLMVPDVVLLLEGNGEEETDIWKSYYLNGKAQFCKAKIVFEDFNPEKMS